MYTFKEIPVRIWGYRLVDLPRAFGEAFISAGIFEEVEPEVLEKLELPGDVKITIGSNSQRGPASTFTKWVKYRNVYLCLVNTPLTTVAYYNIFFDKYPASRVGAEYAPTNIDKILDMDYREVYDLGPSGVRRDEARIKNNVPLYIAIKYICGEDTEKKIDIGGYWPIVDYGKFRTNGKFTIGDKNIDVAYNFPSSPNFKIKRIEDWNLYYEVFENDNMLSIGGLTLFFENDYLLLYEMRDYADMDLYDHLGYKYYPHPIEYYSRLFYYQDREVIVKDSKTLDISGTVYDEKDLDDVEAENDEVYSMSSQDENIYYIKNESGWEKIEGEKEDKSYWRQHLNLGIGTASSDTSFFGNRTVIRSMNPYVFLDKKRTNSFYNEQLANVGSRVVLMPITFMSVDHYLSTKDFIPFKDLEFVSLTELLVAFAPGYESFHHVYDTNLKDSTSVIPPFTEIEIDDVKYITVGGDLLHYDTDHGEDGGREMAFNVLLIRKGAEEKNEKT